MSSSSTSPPASSSSPTWHIPPVPLCRCLPSTPSDPPLPVPVHETSSPPRRECELLRVTGKCLGSLMNAIGPEIQGMTRVKERALLWIQVMRSHWDPVVRGYAITSLPLPCRTRVPLSPRRAGGPHLCLLSVAVRAEGRGSHLGDRSGQ